MGTGNYIRIAVLMLILLVAAGCGGSGDSVQVILTTVPTGDLSGALGTGDLAGAWHLKMLSTVGGELRDYYFIVEQTSATTGIAFLSSLKGMTWVEIGMTGTTYSITVSEYWPRTDFESQYIYTGTRAGNMITGNFVGDAKDNFFTSDSGHFSGTFEVEIIPAGADFLTPTGIHAGGINGAMGDGLTDIELDGAMSFEISGSEVEGTLTFDILDDYGMPMGDTITDLPFNGTLTGADNNEFTCSFVINQNGWTGDGTIIGYMADLQSMTAGWLYGFVSSGKFNLSHVTTNALVAEWTFRGGWSAH